jgi:hypothetical protein
MIITYRLARLFGGYGGVFRVELRGVKIAGTHPITMRSGFEQSDEGRITG